ncbi:hypothetical protein [Beijerinckia sp. L45]|uniref:hypothetical protein n=1 Tax=Beijerinckia sp. L45 TaxID=1641855 RepID=UPI001FEDB2AD|nr:hypothetical protein [Beijerinckia sp. L45]
MKPMAPMASGEAWWPKDLGEPASSGSQDDLRYAFFPAKKRLLVERGGTRKTYDSGDHQISGVSQQNGTAASPTFTSQQGTVDLEHLTVLD